MSSTVGLAWDGAVATATVVPAKRQVENKRKRGKGEQIKLLKGVNGFCETGTVTALMGPSGAGKSTLLDVLAGRKNTGTVEGKILVNGVGFSFVFFHDDMASHAI